MSFLQSPYHIGSHGRMTDWVYRGAIAGFSSGGANHYGGGGTGVWYGYSDIFSHSFTTDGNAVDSTGNLTASRWSCSGCSSEISSFIVSGGGSNIIESFSNTNPAAGATDLADLNVTSNGTSVSGLTHGYFCKDTTGVGALDKFAYVNTANAVGVGDLNHNYGNSRYGGSTDSVSNYGYMAGGTGNSPAIERFSFDNETISNDVGNCTSQTWTGGETMGCSSETHGYHLGKGSCLTNIDKYAFSSSGNATDVGDLVHDASNWNGNCSGSGRGNGMSSITHGYVAGGELYTDIDKFAFANESNQTDIGDLGSGVTTLRCHHASSHY